MKKSKFWGYVAWTVPAIPFLMPSFNSWITMYQAFAFPVIFGYALAGLFFLVRERWQTSLWTLFMGLVTFTAIFTHIYQRPKVLSGAADLKVAHFNVLKTNDDHKAILKAAIASDATLISFQEVSPGWAKSLDTGLAKTYPYSRIEPRADGYGIAVFSKYPLIDLQTVYLQQVPNLAGKIRLPEADVGFTISHLITPITETSYRLRNKHIRQIGKHVLKNEGPQLVIGDYNTVPWDSAISNFKSRTRLMDSRKGFSATFPNWLSLPMIPIDYIFHSPEIACLGFQTIERTSSDHLGIIGSYRMKDR